MISLVAAGLVLLVGCYVLVLVARRRIARRRATSIEAMDLALARWRDERRRRRAVELRAWQRDFDSLLPPVPCDGSDHNHVDVVRFGTREVQVVCVPAPVPMSRGGFVPGVDDVARPQRYVVPGERIVSQREIADRLGTGGITVEQAIAAMRRLAR